jgi:hypothetical protein
MNTRSLNLGTSEDSRVVTIEDLIEDSSVVSTMSNIFETWFQIQINSGTGKPELDAILSKVYFYTVDGYSYQWSSKLLADLGNPIDQAIEQLFLEAYSKKDKKFVLNTTFRPRIAMERYLGEIYKRINVSS